MHTPDCEVNNSKFNINAMNEKDKSIIKRSSHSEIDQFLDNAKSLSRSKTSSSGRLMFVMDATYSRRPTWDLACQIQGEMFLTTDQIGDLEIKLAYYSGVDTFKVSNWIDNSRQLLKLMSSVDCEGGKTQITRVLKYTINQQKKQSMDAVVFVGDCMEENPDLLSDLAGQLGLLGVPLFIFQEGHDAIARQTFKHMCKLSNGAYCAFDAGSADQLKALLSAVAVYAAAGRTAYLDYAKKHQIAGLLE